MCCRKYLKIFKYIMLEFLVKTLDRMVKGVVSIMVIGSLIIGICIIWFICSKKNMLAVFGCPDNPHKGLHYLKEDQCNNID